MEILNTVEIFEKKTVDEKRLSILKSLSVDHGHINKYTDLNNNIIQRFSVPKSEVSSHYQHKSII